MPLPSWRQIAVATDYRAFEMRDNPDPDVMALSKALKDIVWRVRKAARVE